MLPSDIQKDALSFATDPATSPKWSSRGPKSPTSTLYSDPSADLDTPETLLVSHEYTKDRKIRNTAIILKKMKLDTDNITIGTNQVMIKLTTSVDVVTKAEVKALLTTLVMAFFSNDLRDYLTGEPSAADLFNGNVDGLQLDRILNEES